MRTLKFILAQIFVLGASATFFAIPWGFKNYPLHMPWNVFFVLSSNTSGHDSGTGLSILKGFVIPAIICFVIFNLILLFFKKKNISKLVDKAFKVTGIYFASSVICLLIAVKAPFYFKIAATISKTPSTSVFYDNNFIDDSNFKVIPSKQKRNIIFIFLESMEPGFTNAENGGFFEENLIPELTELAAKNISFSETNNIGGGINLQGTSWTVAGMLSKLCSVPFFLPFTTDSEGNKHCLSKATTLNDILFMQGYKQIFGMGSEKQFEDRDCLLEDHHVTIHDINWYKENNFIPKDYQVFWGFEDLKLYEIAKKELSALSDSKEPFFYGMLTVDTHFPKGFKCSECTSTYKYQMQNVVRCADRQLGSFIKWIQTQSWYENTTIMICGDHAYLNAPLNNFTVEQGILPKKQIESNRRFINIVINPAVEVPEEKIKGRKYSSFDIAPTLLELCGNKIEGKGIYLGRSLISNEKTLCELYSQKEIETETMKKVIDYVNLK